MRRIGKRMRGLVACIILFFCLAVVTAQEPPDFFVEASIDNPNPFVGQQIVYSYRLYIRSGRINRGSTVKPDFKGFWRQDYSKIIESTELHNGELYRVRESHTILYPTQAGQITIEPTTFVIPRDAFGPSEVQMTDAVIVDAQPLPDRDLAAGFTGLVGQFELIQTLDRQITSVGEPIRLQLTVRGTGNIEQVPIPDLIESDGWRIYADPGNYVAVETDDGRMIGEKTFEWLLTPTQAGQYVIPQIELSYFDLASLQYQPVNLTPIVVDVQGVNDAVAAAPTPVTASLTLRPIPAVLGVGDHTAILLDIIFLILWIVPPIVTPVVWWRMRVNRLRLENATFYRRSEALQHARRTLSAAHKQSDGMVYKLMQTAIMTYFADKLDRAAGSLHYADIVDAMRQRQIEPTVAEAILECLQVVDQALYTPVDQADTEGLADHVAHLLSALDAAWGSS